MDNFCQFWNKINGEPYTDGVPAPVEYKIQDMDIEGINQFDLKPLSDEDMAQVSDEEVKAQMELKKKMGWNPTRLGPPMSDDALHKHYGL